MKRPVWERKLIYMVRAGSHAYGMNTPESDLDLRGICLLDKEHVLGNTRFEGYQPSEKGREENDIAIYSIIKFMNLASALNPNVVEILAVDSSDILFMDPIMQSLRENIDLFLSQRAYHSFSGYAFSQLKRIKRHRAYLLNPPKTKPTRSQFGLPESHSLLNIEEMNAFIWLVTQLLQDSMVESTLSKETKDELSDIDWPGLVNSSDLPEECGPILEDLTGSSKELIRAVMAERKYRKALKQWKAYQSWKKHRNAARADLEKKFGFDTKHASHLCRLLSMGIEILRGEGVIVKRPDASWLLDIRRGAMTYEEVERWAAEKKEEMEQAYSTTKLPKKPNYKAIENLQMRLIERGFDFPENDAYKLYKEGIFGEKYPFHNRSIL